MSDAVRLVMLAVAFLGLVTALTAIDWRLGLGVGSVIMGAAALTYDDRNEGER